MYISGDGTGGESIYGGQFPGKLTVISKTLNKHLHAHTAFTVEKIIMRVLARINNCQFILVSHVYVGGKLLEGIL